MDCVYMAGSKKLNDGFKFLLCVIDCWSKFAWVFKLKALKCVNVIKCLRILFSQPEAIPEKIGTDRGSGNENRVTNLLVTLPW